MFVGRPEGNYDRLLDFSRAVTGNLFFVPSLTLLEALADDAAQPVAAVPTETTPPAGAAGWSYGSGSLHIGSLRGASTDEQPAP